MPDKVKDWMSHPVVVVDPDSSVSYALTLMRRRKIHSLVVDVTQDMQASYGIVTTTDIRDKIIIANRNPADTRIREIMSSPVIVGDPDWTLRECSLYMQENGIHHIPVANKDGMLIGLISVTDIFMAVEEIGWGEKS